VETFWLLILSAAAAHPPQHPRAGGWSVEQGTWGCRVSSPADWPDRTVLALTHRGWPSLDIRILRRGFEPVGKAARFPIDLLASGRESSLAQGTASLVGADQEWDQFSLEPVAMEAIAAADTPESVFELRAEDGQHRPVALGGVARAWADAKACRQRVEGLLLDARPPGEPATADPRPPVPRSVQVTTPSDYPARALRNEEQGDVTATVAVDRSGFPSGCTVAQSSGSDALDKETCRLLTSRARFYPARDAGHQPVEGTWSRTVGWRIAN
jgi:TonB family protein